MARDWSRTLPRRGLAVRLIALHCLPSTIMPPSRGGTLISLARRYWETPFGLRNSSRDAVETRHAASESGRDMSRPPARKRANAGRRPARFLHFSRCVRRSCNTDGVALRSLAAETSRRDVSRRPLQRPCPRLIRPAVYGWACKAQLCQSPLPAGFSSRGLSHCSKNKLCKSRPSTLVHSCRVLYS